MTLKPNDTANLKSFQTTFPFILRKVRLKNYICRLKPQLFNLLKENDY